MSSKPMKIHHNPTPMAERLAHVLRNDRELSTQQISQIMGVSTAAIFRTLRSPQFLERKEGRISFWSINPLR